MKITITQQKEEFKPFVLSLEIESKDDLIELYNRFNLLEIKLKEILGFDYEEHSSANAYEIFKILELKLSNNDQ